MADAFLFQAQAILRKRKEEIMFFRGQVWELADETWCACDTESSKGRECFLIHHNRSNVRPQRAQARQNLEALCVQVTPVEDGAFCEPGDILPVAHHKAAAEKRGCVPPRRKLEKR